MIELPNVTALYVFLAFGICYWILKKYLFVPLSAILDAMKTAGAVSDAQYKDLSKLLDQAYGVIEKDEAYNPRQFLAALQAFEAAVPRS